MFSQRITTLTGQDLGGWDLFLKSRAMVAAGEKITELTIGEHDIPTSADILDALHSAAKAGHTGYADIPGLPDLRDKVAERVQATTGVPTTRDNVIITAGGQAGLLATQLLTCDQGDHALFIDPFYPTYPGSIRAAGGVPVAVNALAERGFQLDVPAIDEAAARTGAKSLLINTPNNPTGTIYGRAELEALAEVAKARDFWVISDEVYDSQIWEGAHLSMRALDGMAERTLVIGSMSKSHAMTGSRVGWIVGPKAAIAHLVALSTHSTYGVPGYIQHAALFALNKGQGFEDEISEPFARRRLIALDILAGQNVLRVSSAQGAMYMFVDIAGSGLSGRDFAEKLLDERKIAVMPGISFGQVAKDYVRIAMTVDDETFGRAIQDIAAFAQAQV
ncbi:pyridoxal phosphate-dependent aminotransferase [Epibacterium sp. Ofav1-8]|uniref:pyridoxal phosphate-dependent aminotransferase n=1 Tax=Epibacterium sp. Ofav1-8 TaxID=2917735 RepID=UPI001EF3E47C|nr:pyridoxal phosphate-dependent aminotransferase [Epibacterium sp. Ofav1-8]MCG7625166.1 pyridoxal phosphate-dependent aminotransferase [Epibacterium sp. Ofav1-8]